MGVELEGGGSMDQIRELLFGAAQRQQESRSGQLESKLDRAASEAAERLAKAQSQVDFKLTSTAAGLTADIERLAAALEAAEAEAGRDNQALEDTILTRIGDLEQTVRENIQALSDDTEKRIAALEAELAATASRLDDQKTDRHDLGDYLIEFGMRLKGGSALEALKESVKEALGDRRDDNT